MPAGHSDAGTLRGASSDIPGDMDELALADTPRRARARLRVPTGVLMTGWWLFLNDLGVGAATLAATAAIDWWWTP